MYAIQFLLLFSTFKILKRAKVEDCDRWKDLIIRNAIFMKVGDARSIRDPYRSHGGIANGRFIVSGSLGTS